MAQECEVDDSYLYREKKLKLDKYAELLARDNGSVNFAYNGKSCMSGQKRKASGVPSLHQSGVSVASQMNHYNHSHDSGPSTKKKGGNGDHFYQGTSNSDGDYNIVVGEVLQSSNKRYRVLEFLGRGTFGQVVKCRNEPLSHDSNLVAVKILKNHPSYQRQGNIEISILQTLCREDTEKCNIVRALECFQHKQHTCLVFELLEQNLYDYLKANKFKPMALSQIRPIVQQVLYALNQLKQLRLIHADLKPENIMLVNSIHTENQYERFKVKVIDFGSACYSHKTVTNTYLQSRYYRAPEVLLGLPFDEAIDMWSLGCVLAELYLGWPLYPGASEYDQVRYIISTQGIPSRELLMLGGKVRRFFTQDHFGNFILKPSDVYTSETGTKSKEVRKYIFTNLLQIEDAYTGTNGISYAMATKHVLDHGNTQFGESLEVYVEAKDRRQFALLLESMLKLRKKERITPHQALNHPFVTMNHFREHIPLSKRAQDALQYMMVCKKDHCFPQTLPSTFQIQSPIMDSFQRRANPMSERAAIQQQQQQLQQQRQQQQQQQQQQQSLNLFNPMNQVTAFPPFSRNSMEGFSYENLHLGGDINVLPMQPNLDANILQTQSSFLVNPTDFIPKATVPPYANRSVNLGGLPHDLNLAGSVTHAFAGPGQQTGIINFDVLGNGFTELFKPTYQHSANIIQSSLQPKVNSDALTRTLWSMYNSNEPDANCCSAPRDNNCSHNIVNTASIPDSDVTRCLEICLDVDGKKKIVPVGRVQPIVKQTNRLKNAVAPVYGINRVMTDIDCYHVPAASFLLPSSNLPFLFLHNTSNFRDTVTDHDALKALLSTNLKVPILPVSQPAPNIIPSLVQIPVARNRYHKLYAPEPTFIDFIGQQCSTDCTQNGLLNI